jgi:hypothetical protein
VEGIERVVIAAELSESGRRDLVTVGSDEGGYEPRVFRWKNGVLSRVIVPAEYGLREESDWSPDCMERINPQFVGDRRITLLRETISPASLKGHGEDCNLPRDTLEVRGDSLVRVRTSP